MTDKQVAARIDIERRVVRKLIRVAKAHGFNLVRIWAGAAVIATDKGKWVQAWVFVEN